MEKLDAMVECFAEVTPLAEQTQADATVTALGIIAVLSEAEMVEAARGGE